MLCNMYICTCAFLSSVQNTFNDYSNSSPGKHLSISYIFFIIGIIAATDLVLFVCFVCYFYSVF